MTVGILLNSFLYDDTEFLQVPWGTYNYFYPTDEETEFQGSKNTFSGAQS